MLWIENSPTITPVVEGENVEEVNRDLLEFIDKTISCRIPKEPSEDMPSEDFEHYMEMKELIKRVGHRCKENCFKRNSKVCRYGFPKPVAAKTWIEVIPQLNEKGKVVRENYEIHLKRNANETNINNYNPFFLKV